MSDNPFTRALGASLDSLPGPVREHFAMAGGTRCYQGTMKRVWRRAGLAGWLAWPAPPDSNGEVWSGGRARLSRRP